MSDHWIGIIPRNPFFVPSDESIARTKKFMAEVAPEAEGIRSEITDAVRFRDCGVNLTTIRCPFCDAELSSEWWSERMGEDWDADFELRQVELPCGHEAGSLNDLRYDFDQGFSRFILDAMNPNIGVLTPSEISHFEEWLGCPVKVIYQHI
jgi:hypothetical protein